MPQLTREELIALSKVAQYEFDSLARVSSSSDWAKLAAEMGFAEVGGKWLEVIPGYASTIKQSVTTAGAAAGTTATIYETVTSPVSKIIASNTGTKVTTSGILTATSTSVGAVACAGALGFVTGVNAFEAAPEFWTKVSNAVFGTDLNPEEIGEITRDTNALVMIKDGVCYMAEDMINAIRNAFFDNGAADSSVVYPTITDTIPITITSWGNIQEIIAGYMSLLSGITFDNAQFQSVYEEFQTFTGYGAYKGAIYYKSDGTIDEVTLEIKAGQPSQELPWDTTASKTLYGTETYYECQQLTMAPAYWIRLDWNKGSKFFDRNSNYAWAYKFNSRQQPVYYGVGTSTATGGSWTSSLNTTLVGTVDGVTPTGEQGTKEQTLDEVFPEWVAKAVTTIGDFPDTVRRWLPITLPSTLVETQGNPLTITEAQTGALPLAETEAALQLQANTDPVTTTQTGEAVRPTPLPLPTPTITPTPDTPSISGGGGSSTGLANLYNPTLAQVKQFSRWLWGSDGLNLDQLKKLLQDPMQAIIGLHVMYATPTTGANRDIQVGYINSGVPSKIVTEQYTEIDCGTVTINEYFGDARDYSPYTQVYCYLPFIGIVELNADDVVNSTLGIKYKIDVLTGCCLAQLTVKKYGLDAVLYTYTGNCAVQMPITSGNYLSTVTSLLGAVVSGAAAVATGGALAPVAIGAAANAMGGGARASVAMSGSLGSNAGAMGIRKPYLIIKRVESADANGYNEFYGYPTNKRVNLSQLTGYVRVKEINLSGTNATEDEQNEIVALLKEGVIL